MISVRVLLCLVTLLFLLNDIICPPVTDRPTKPAPAEEEEEEDVAANLEYNRYLREVVNVLESDEAFRQKLEASNISEIKSGEIAKHLDFVGHGIRTQLDELKRREVDRLNQVVRLRTHLQNGLKRKNPDAVLSPINRDSLMGHLDHGNPGSFEMEDLAKLIIKAAADLEDMDEKRRNEFKRYEMEKEYLRQKELDMLDAQKKAEVERKFKEQEKKHAEHPKLLHPGNEAQLKEVWEDSDGLNKKDFDPRTFFNMHDTNGDGFLDEAEVEALFQNELDKMYDPNAPEDDMMERYEEMNRMREHVMNEVDTNKDRLISLEEFIQNSKSQEFKKNKPWETLDEKKVFSEDDFAEFDRQKKRLEEEELENRRIQAARSRDQLGGDVPNNRGGVNVMNQRQQQHNEQQPPQQQPNVQQPPRQQPNVQQPPQQQPNERQQHPSEQQQRQQQQGQQQPHEQQQQKPQQQLKSNDQHKQQQQEQQQHQQQQQQQEKQKQQQENERKQQLARNGEQPANEQPANEQPANEQPANEQPAAVTPAAV